VEGAAEILETFSFSWAGEEGRARVAAATGPGSDGCRRPPELSPAGGDGVSFPTHLLILLASVPNMDPFSHRDPSL